MVAETIEKYSRKDFIRDGEYVKDFLKIIDNRLITTEDLSILVPLRFLVNELLVIGDEISIVGFFPLIIHGRFGVCNVNSMITINPSTFNKVDVDGNKYYKFFFDKNTIVFKNTNLIKTDTTIYPLFNEIIAHGNVPWYVNYEDYGNIFSTALEYANSNIAANPSLVHILVSMQSRNRKNRSMYYRQVIKDYSDIENNPPDFIPLKSVVFSATDTVNKLAGSYFKDGVVSALANPTERTERLESILKA